MVADSTSLVMTRQLGVFGLVIRRLVSGFLFAWLERRTAASFFQEPSRVLKLVYGL